ncbi:MAG TPA: ABC transporter ATP-binding protein [Rhodoblastus sp.]|nr:ABC transporter ATP-binding protein [Rhodoblastus sp.]
MSIISIAGLAKTYGKFTALHDVDLDIERGEIFALLGPNGAGKTTLISIVCGAVSMSRGRVSVDGADIQRDYRVTRRKIGLVPQEIALDIFATVWSTVSFSRTLFGKPTDKAHVERLLRDLALWDKRDNRIIELSGGMKRRVMIAKALAHEPDILFLDEPTAGVDVELRRDMWGLVRRLRENGVTIILTTHYIEEAEEMADRVGIMKGGRLVLVEEKKALMRKLGKRRLVLTLAEPLAALPEALGGWHVELEDGGRQLAYAMSEGAEKGAAQIIQRLGEAGVAIKDMAMNESSLEQIFVDLVGAAA